MFGFVNGWMILGLIALVVLAVAAGIVLLVVKLSNRPNTPPAVTNEASEQQ